MTEQHHAVIGELQRALGRVEGCLEEFKEESSRQRSALFEKVDSQGHQLTELVAQVQNLIALAQNAASVPALTMRMTNLEQDMTRLTPRVDALHEKEVGRKAVVGAAAAGGATLATLLPHAWTAVKAWFQHHPPG